MEPYKVVSSFQEIPENPVSFATGNVGKFKPQFLDELKGPLQTKKVKSQKILIYF